MKPRKLTFADAQDARDYLSTHGYRRFSERTWQHRHNYKTARVDHARGMTAVTIL